MPPPPERSSLAASLLLVIGAGLAFATSGPLTRWAGPVHPLAIVFGRVALAALALLLVDGRATLRALGSMPPRGRAGVALAGVVLGAHFALFVWGLQSTSLPAAVTLVSLEPLSVVVWAFALHGARPNRLEWFGLCVATAGAVLVGSGQGEGGHRLKGDLLVVGAVILYGLYVAAARSLRDSLPARAYVTLVYAACALSSGIALAIATDPAGTAWRSISLHALVAIALLALIPTLIGHTAVQSAARHAPAALVALVSPGETVGALALGALFQDAIPTGRESAGALVILGGVALAIRGIQQSRADNRR